MYNHLLYQQFTTSKIQIMLCALTDVWGNGFIQI